jgi:hypothetical protein
MEQSAAVGPRVQLTLARLNIEEQRVTHLAGELDRIRGTLEGATSNLKNGPTSSQMANVSSRLRPIRYDARGLKWDCWT